MLNFSKRKSKKKKTIFVFSNERRATIDSKSSDIFSLSSQTLSARKEIRRPCRRNVETNSGTFVVQNNWQPTPPERERNEIVFFFLQLRTQFNINTLILWRIVLSSSVYLFPSLSRHLIVRELLCHTKNARQHGIALFFDKYTTESHGMYL